MATFQIGNFFIGIIVTQLAGPEAMGALQYFVVTSTFFSYFGRMGGDENIGYTLPSLGGLASEKGQFFVRKIIKTAFVASILSALAMWCFSVGLDWAASKEIQWVTPMFSFIYLPVFVSGLLMASIFRAEQMSGLRAVIVYFFPIAINLLFLIVLIIVLDFKSGNMAILARTIAYLGTFLLALYLCNKSFKALKLFRSLPEEDDLVRKSSPTAGQGWLLITLLVFVIDSGTMGIWLSKSLLSDAEVGYLSVVIRLSALLLVVPTALTIVMGPVFVRLRREASGRRVRIITLAINAALVICTYFVLALFPEFWLGLFGEALIAFKDDFLLMLLGVSALAITQPLYSLALAHQCKKVIIFIGSLAISTFVVFSLVQDIETVRDVINGLVLSTFVVGVSRLGLLKLI